MKFAAPHPLTGTVALRRKVSLDRPRTFINRAQKPPPRPASDLPRQGFVRVGVYLY